MLGARLEAASDEMAGPEGQTLHHVGATGFEPATSRSQSGRSTKLSYAPENPHARERPTKV